MTAVRKELRRRRKPLGLATVLVAFAAVLVFAFGSSATIGGSPFEAEDGNLIQNTSPNPDWATVAEARKNDQPTGQQDDSFGNGTKEDTPVPSIVNGSIPNNKSDLKTFGVYNQTTAGGGSFMELFWTRVQEPNGTTNMDFEFNQSSQLSANGVTPVRTAGDVLIQYDLAQGGTHPVLSASRWVTTGAGSQCEANNAVPCWGTKVNLTTSGDATGSINTSPISAADSDGLGALGARTFGEAEVNLAALGGGPGHCFSFGSAYLKSRASDSFTAAVKDFIAPETINVGQCGSVIIRKVTDPVSDPATLQFGYTKSFSTDPATGNTFTLGHGQSKAYTDSVLPGNGYTVTEDTLPAGWDFDHVDCSASSGVTVDTSAAPLISFNIDSPSDVVDCTYTNKARAKLTIRKVTDDGSGAFDFTSNTLTPASWTLTTTGSGNANGDQRVFSNLVPGTYDSAETVPAGWNLVSSSCSNGDDPSAVTLAAGGDVTCTYHNARERGAIDIEKLRKHAADGPGNHPHAGVTFTVFGGELPAQGVSVVTNAAGHACVTGLVLSSFVGPYSVVESVPTGYHPEGNTTKSVSVTEEAAGCGAESPPPASPDADVQFVNIPLTTVTLSIDSIIPGGTASTGDCNGTALVQGTGGDASVTLSNLEPGSVTCTITIDP